MADLDRTVADALAAAAGRVGAAPPFHEIRRRHTRDRARRLVTATAAALAVVATAAVALPRTVDVDPAGPKPYASLRHDPAALQRVRECLYGSPVPAFATSGPEYFLRDERSRRCFTDNGYETPTLATRSGTFDPRFPPEDSGWYVCADPPAETPRATLASGTVADGVAWRVVTWEGRDGARCVSWRTDPAGESAIHGDTDDDTGPIGGLKPRLAWDVAHNSASDSYVVLWGAVDPKVVKVRIRSNTGQFDVPTVRLPETPDRAYVAYVFRNAGHDMIARWTLLDASGREVPTPPR